MKKKRVWMFAAVICLVAGILSFGTSMAQQQEEIPENPVQGISEEASQVLWTGQGYKTKLAVDDPQAAITEEILNIETEIRYDDSESGQNQEMTESGDDDSNQDGAQVPGDYEEDKYYPTIASDLTDGEIVNGSYRTFYVRAEDYKGNYIGAGGLEVTGNGERLYSTADDGEMVRYRLDLRDGENTILIRATDRNDRSTVVSYTIYKGDETAAEPAGTVTFSLEATTVGLGYLIGPSEEVFYEGEQLSYFIDRVLQEHGYTYRYEGNLTNGFYLKHIVRTGITNGWNISEELQEHLKDVNSAIGAYHSDSLGEYDFTSDSGWLYFVNDAHMSSGISTYYPADGDVIRIRFSLYDGADVGSSMHGETWGDW